MKKKKKGKKKKKIKKYICVKKIKEFMKNIVYIYICIGKIIKVRDVRSDIRGVERLCLLYLYFTVLIISSSAGDRYLRLLGILDIKI